MAEPVRLADPAPARRTGLTVFVRGLHIAASIGVYAHERGRHQPLTVDVELELDERPIGGLADTVNYERVAESARAVADSGHVELVEDYAERLALACLRDARVRAVRVRVEKPEALKGAAAAGCEMVFRR